MGVASWVVFGAIAGWLAAKVGGGKNDRGCLTNIVIGIAGAVFSGSVITLITGKNWVTKFNIPSLAVAVIGSIVLIAALQRLGGGRNEGVQ